MVALDQQHGKDQVGAKLASSTNTTDNNGYQLLEDVRHKGVTLGYKDESSPRGAAAIKAVQEKLNMWLARNGMPTVRENGILMTDNTHKSTDGYELSGVGTAILIFQQAQGLPRPGPWIGAKTLTELDKITGDGNDGVANLKKDSQGHAKVTELLNQKIREVSKDPYQRETLEGKHGAEAQRDLRQKLASSAYKDYGKNFPTTFGN